MGNSSTRALTLACALVAATAQAAEWTNWRGPTHDGVSPETGLISSWSTEGENLIWRADLAILYDTEGGYLIQPGLRWKPNRQFTVEGFVNIVDGSNDNQDMLSTLQWTDELSLRLTWQF